MQPDVRQSINKTGFCGKHYEMMYGKSKKLPLGLACYTRIEHIRENLDKYFDKIISEQKSFKKSSAAQAHEYIKKTIGNCAVCENIEENMKRYLYTFIHLWKTDEEFAREFLLSKGLCLHHFAELMEFASDEFGDTTALKFSKELAEVQKKNLQRLSEEVKAFNDKFDHRNVGSPWGSEKDALPRAINKLSGRIIK